MASVPEERELVWYLPEPFGVPGSNTIDVDPTLFPSVCPHCAAPGTAPCSVSFAGLSMVDASLTRSVSFRVAGEVLKFVTKVVVKVFVDGPLRWLIRLAGSAAARPLTAEAARIDPNTEPWVVTLWFCRPCRQRYRVLSRAALMLQWGGLGLILVCTFTLIGGGRGSETIAGFSLVGYLIGFVLIGVGVPFRLAAAKHHGVMLRFDVGRRALCARFQHPGVYEAMQRAAGNAS